MKNNKKRSYGFSYKRFMNKLKINKEIRIEYIPDPTDVIIFTLNEDETLTVICRGKLEFEHENSLYVYQIYHNLFNRYFSENIFKKINPNFGNLALRRKR